MAVMSKPREYIGRKEFARRLGITIGAFNSDRSRGRLPDPALKILAGVRPDGVTQYTYGWTEQVVAAEVARREESRAKRAAKRESTDD